MDHERYEAFRRWRNAWGAAAADAEIDFARERHRTRNHRHYPVDLDDPLEYRAMLEIEDALARELVSRPGEFYATVCRPLHERIHAATTQEGQEAALAQAEAVMSNHPAP